MKLSNRLFLLGLAALFLTMIVIFIKLQFIEGKFDRQWSTPAAKSYTINPVKANNSLSWTYQFSPDFNTLNIDGAFDITVLSGHENKVIIESKEVQFKNLEFYASGKILNIRTLTSLSASTVKPKLIITTSSLDTLLISGDNNLHIANMNTTHLTLKLLGNNTADVHSNIDNLQLQFYGESQARIQTNSKIVNVRMIGEHKTILSGAANTLNIYDSGNANVYAKDFKVNDISIENVSARSELEVHAIKTLKIATIGKSKVSFYGNPKIEKSTVGSTILHRMDNNSTTNTTNTNYQS